MIDSTDLPNPADHPLQKAARAVADIIPKEHGFIIITSPFRINPDDKSGRGYYVSNVDRGDAIAILKTLLFRWGVNDEWMKEAK